MSVLAALLTEHESALLRRCSERGVAAPEVWVRPCLRAAAELLRGSPLTAELLLFARIVGETRFSLGLDVPSVVRGFETLRSLCLELAESTELPVPASQLRALSDFIGAATGEAIESRQRGHSTDAERTSSPLFAFFDNAPAFMCMLDGPEHVYSRVNPLYQKLIGASRVLVGRRVAEAVPEVVSQGFLTILDGVLRTGEPFVGRELPLVLDREGDGRMADVFVNFVYQPRRAGAGPVTGIDVFGFEVTEHVVARRRAEELAITLREEHAGLRQAADARVPGRRESIVPVI